VFGKKDKSSTNTGRASNKVAGASRKDGARKGATFKAGAQPRTTENPKAVNPSSAVASPKSPTGLSKSSDAKAKAKAGSAKKSFRFQSYYLRYHQDCAKASLTRLDNARLATGMTAALVAVSLTLPMLLLLVISNLQQLSSGWQDQLSVSVYMNTGVKPQKAAEINQEIAGLSGVEKSRLITPEQGLEEFKSLAGSELLAVFDENPLPAVIEFIPTVDSSQDDYQFQLAELVRKVESLDGVDEVVFDMVWVQRLLNYVGFAERFAILIGVLLALAAVLAISNTIRLEIENRRQEIIVIKLVGGTDSFIRLPFLYSGFWYGVLGATIATVSLWLIGLWLSPFIGRLLSLYSSDLSIDYLGLMDVFWLYFCSIALAVAGAWLAVYRHLDEIEPE